MFFASSLSHLLVWSLFYPDCLIRLCCSCFLLRFCSTCCFLSFVLLAACFPFVLLSFALSILFCFNRSLALAISLLFCFPLFSSLFCSAAASRLRSLFSYTLCLLFLFSRPAGFCFFSYFRLLCLSPCRLLCFRFSLRFYEFSASCLSFFPLLDICPSLDPSEFSFLCFARALFFFCVLLPLLFFCWLPSSPFVCFMSSSLFICFFDLVCFLLSLVPFCHLLRLLYIDFLQLLSLFLLYFLLLYLS